MRNLDILAAENGEHVRVLLCGEEQSYVVSCQHFRMPYPVASDLLAELQPVPAEAYSVFVLDEDITNRQREGRNRKLDLIAPLLVDGFTGRATGGRFRCTLIILQIRSMTTIHLLKPYLQCYPAGT